MDIDQPILITGAHRSGTTWVGKMLSASNQLVYISEPLNVLHRPGVMRAPVRHWYTYICEQNEYQYLPSLRETLSFKYHAWAEIKSLRSSKDAARMGRDWRNFSRARRNNQRPLVKDPFAIFSSPWFSRRLQCQVIVLVRHPAAIASSLKRLNWPFDFNHLLQQPLLMRDWLHPFQGEMEAMRENPQDIIGGSSLLWRMIYHVVNAYQETVHDLQLVRHEDLSRDPLGGFRDLCANVSIEFTPELQRVVEESSSPSNPGELSERAVHGTRLDSRASIDNWKQNLTPEEITRVMDLTGDIVTLYYTDQDWE
jgi:hypothetical protein